MVQVNELVKKLANLPKEQREQLLANLQTRQQQARQEQSPSVVPSASASERWPLSYTQMRLWMLDCISGPSSAYNMATAMDINGALDCGALEKAVTYVIDRHLALKTKFDIDNDLPVQRFPLEPTSFKLNVIELTHEQANAYVKKFVSRPFNLNEDELFRFELIRLNDEAYIFMVNIHHIVADGWSIKIISGEIAQAYEAYVQHKEPCLAPLYGAYSDFVCAQNSEEAIKREKSLMTFWQEYMNDAPPLLELPLDYARPSQASNEGASFNFSISAELREQLDSTARKYKASSFVILMSAYILLLSRYTNQNDVVIGTPAANREEKWKNNVGMFVNTLVVRSYLHESDSFAEFLAKSKKNWLSVFTKQELPFEQLVDVLRPKRTLSHAPLVQNMFSFHDASKDALSLNGLSVNKKILPVKDIKFDLLMAVEVNDSGYNATLEYSSEIYSSETIERFSQSYLTLLSAIVENPEQNILQLPILADNETDKINAVLNNTQQSFDTKTLMHELFIKQAELTPHAAAMIHRGKTMSYGELLIRSGQLAYKLRQQNVQPGELVAVLCKKGFEQVIGVMGVLMSGAAYLPIEPDWPKDRILHLLEFGLVKHTITQTDIASREFLVGKQNYFLLDAAEPIDTDAPFCTDVVQTMDDIAYVIFTSGSTGTPKGVVIQHKSVVNTLHDINSRFNVTSDDRTIAISALSFDLSVYDIFGLLAVGGAIVIPEDEHNKDPGYWLNLVEDHKVSLWNTVPALLQMLVDFVTIERRRIGDSLRWCFLSGDWIPLELPTQVKQLSSNVEVHSGGGATEGSIWSITYPIEKIEPEWSSIPYGKPLANQSFYILNDKLQQCPLGVTGNLFIGGIGVAHSYWRDKEKTDERFIQCPLTGERLYKTGDLGKLSSQGLIEFMGRADFQVKINGYRVELGEIESVIRQQGNLKNVLAVVKDDGLHKRLIAYIASEDVVNIADLKRKISAILPSYMMPSAFICVKAFPLTANGKVDHKRLPSGDFEQEAETAEQARNPVEAEIAQIFCRLLERDFVGIHQNFFELGGHSLSAAKLVARLRSVFGIDLTVRALFLSPTVAELSEKVTSLKKSSAHQGLEKVEGNRLQHSVSPIQLGLWVQCQLDGSTKAYNMPATIKLSGDLDVEKLEKALSLLIARHPSLRTNFANKDGDLLQQIHEYKKFSLSREFLSANSDDDLEAQIQRISLSHASTEFDLERSDLLKVTLVRTDVNTHYLFFCVHHMVCDGWSFMVLLRELSLLYSNNNDTERLHALSYDYVDYSAWQSQWLSSEHCETQLAFWRKKLHQVPQLTFPFEQLDMSVPQSLGTTLPFALNEAASSRVFEAAKKIGVTPYVWLISAFNVLVAWASHQQDIVVGTTVAARPLMELEAMVGYFANQVLVRSQINKEATFEAVAESIRQEVMEAIIHQDIPYSMVADAMYSESKSNVSLFRAKFVYQSELSSEVDLPGLTTESLHVDNGSAKFDLLMIMEESKERLKGTLQYRNRYFSSSSINMFVQAWIYLLEESNNFLTVPIIDIFADLDKAYLLKSGAPSTTQTKSLTSIRRKAMPVDA